MAHEIVASIRVTLPDDPQQMAEELSTVAGAWAEFLSAMIPSPAESSFSVNETRGKPGPKPAANGVPRQRKTRTAGNSSAHGLATTPELQAAAQQIAADWEGEVRGNSTLPTEPTPADLLRPAGDGL